MSGTTFCLVTPRLDLIHTVKQYLADRPAWGVALLYATCDGETLLTNLADQAPDLFVFDMQLGAHTVRHLTQTLARAGFQDFIYLAAAGEMAELAGEVIPASAPLSSLLAAIIRRAATSSDTIHITSDAAPVRHRPLTVTVHSPKGGTGKTFLACSLAAQYARKGARTLLVDLSMYGGVAPSLGLPRQDRGLGRVMTQMDQGVSLLELPTASQLLRENLGSFPAGDHCLDVLVPGPPLKMAQLDLQRTEELLEMLGREPYDLVVIDTATEMSERTAVALKTADFILLVMTPELAAAWAIVAMQDLLKNLSLPGKLHVVLNRGVGAIKAEQLEQTVGYPVAAIIPNVAHPWPNGVERDLAYDYSPFALALKRLAQRFHTVYTAGELPALHR